MFSTAEAEYGQISLTEVEFCRMCQDEPFRQSRNQLVSKLTTARMIPSGPADCLCDIRVTNTTKEAALRICTAIPYLGQPLAHQRPNMVFPQSEVTYSQARHLPWCRISPVRGSQRPLACLVLDSGQATPLVQIWLQLALRLIVANQVFLHYHVFICGMHDMNTLWLATNLDR